jgi:hypothetical protein
MYVSAIVRRMPDGDKMADKTAFHNYILYYLLLDIQYALSYAVIKGRLVWL